MNESLQIFGMLLAIAFSALAMGEYFSKAAQSRRTGYLVMLGFYIFLVACVLLMHCGDLIYRVHV